MYTPPLAIAPKAATIWIEVTDISWPMEREYRESPDQSTTPRSSPGDSPGISTPVSLPNPKRESVACRSSRLSRLTACMIPALHECLIIRRG